MGRRKGIRKRSVCGCSFVCASLYHLRTLSSQQFSCHWSIRIFEPCFFGFPSFHKKETSFWALDHQSTLWTRALPSVSTQTDLRLKLIWPARQPSFDMPFHRASAGTTAFTAVHHGDRIHRRPVERYPPRPRHHQDLLTAEVASGDGVITGLVVRRRCGGDRVKRVEWCAGRGGAIYPLCASYGRWLRPTGSIILPSRAARIILKETLSLSLSLSHTDAIREKSVERPLALTFLSLSLSLPLDESLTVEKHWSVFMEGKFSILYSLQSSIGSLQKGSCDKRWDRSSPWKGRSDGRESLASASRQMPR